MGRAQIPQRSEEEFCGTLGPTLGPLCASSPWPKRPPKRVPPDPPKGSPGPPKKDPPKGPPEIPKAKGEGLWGGRIWVDLGLVRQYIYTTGAEGGWGRACGGSGRVPPGPPKPPKP